MRLVAALLIWICAHSVWAFDVHGMYRNMVRANGFIFYPQLVIKNDPEVNAYNKGPVIVVNTGMLKAVRNKHELAMVLGHELAHGKLWHLGSSYAKEFAADKLGVDYMVKAGYNRCVGTKLLKRFKGGDTHPSGSERYKRVRC